MTKICIVAAVAAALAVIAPASAFAAGWFQMMPVISEANGFVASILVLTTFTMTDMRALRIVAIFSNVAFIAYSALEWLPPVLILHLTLLPLNVLRLTQLTARGSTSSECDSPFRSWLRALQADEALHVSRLVTEIRAWPRLLAVKWQAALVLHPILLDMLHAGDTLIVRWVDRLGRSYADVCGTICEFKRHGVTVPTVIHNLIFDGREGSNATSRLGCPDCVHGGDSTSASRSDKGSHARRDRAC
jgi:hypothetical protein